MLCTPSPIDWRMKVVWQISERQIFGSYSVDYFAILFAIQTNGLATSLFLSSGNMDLSDSFLSCKLLKSFAP